MQVICVITKNTNQVQVTETLNCKRAQLTSSSQVGSGRRTVKTRKQLQRGQIEPSDYSIHTL